MRTVVVTASVALGVALAALAGGWVLQASALPPPARGAQAAVRAMSILGRYRVVESALHVDDAAPVHAQCVRGWLRSRAGHWERGVRLRLDGRGALLDVGRRELIATGPTPQRERFADLLLGGCPTVLAATVDAIAQAGATTQRVAGGSALAVALELPRGRIVLDVSPMTDAPLGVTVRFPRVRGWSRIRLGRA